MKTYRVEYIQMIGWQADVVGLWVAENDDWLLLRSIPADFVVDGYVLLAKPHIASRKPKRRRNQVEQTLKLKGVEAEAPAGFVFHNVMGMLQWVEQRYGLVEFADEEESMFLGWIRKTDAVHFWLDMLTDDGTVSLNSMREQAFVISEIQVIYFDTDYFNSIKIYWQHMEQLKFTKPSDN